MSHPDSPRKAVPPPLPKLPYVLLGLLSLLTFAGPFVIIVAVRGGESPHWPPDRAVEWWTFILICLSVVILMGFCVTVGLWSRVNAKGRR